MAFTSITTSAGITTIKVSALSDVSGITLERSGDGYVVKYASAFSRADDTLNSSVTKVRVVVGVGTLESVQKEYSLGLNVGEVRLDASNPLKTEWGSLLSDQMHFAWINGTPGNDTYDFTDTTSPSSVSTATRNLMTEKQRGIWVDLGNGNDTIKGSAYGDNFSIYAASSNSTSTGVKRIDGGANDGTTPWGNKATDSVDVFIKLAQADYTNTANIATLVASITVSAVASSDTDGAGYTHVLKRGDTVLAYLKNIEQVNIQLWRDFNSDSRVQWDSDPTKNEATWAKNIQLTVNVGEIRLDPTDNTKTDWGMKLTDAWHYAWINGTTAADTIVADNLVSDATKALMATNKRGLYIDGGDGNDIITGSAYSDNIVGGSGTDKVDGGANTAPTGDKGQDVFEIRLTATDQTTAQALLNKIKVLPSDDSQYAWMVQRLNDAGAVLETDYLINIEAVSINVNHPTTNQWLAGRWQSIALDVGEIKLDKTDATKTEWGSKISDQMHFAWINGNAPAEVFDYTGTINGAATVSAATKALMVQYQRGLWVDMGGGNDRIVGSPYGDNFSIYAANFNISGLGTRYIDGGTNLGKNSGGGTANDSIDVFVESKSQADLIQVVSLNNAAAAGSEEAVAAASGYTNKILVGTTVLAYIKGIEFVNIQIWNDKSGDGKRQWDANPDNNEMTWVSNIRLVVDVNEIRVSSTDSSKTEWGSNLSDAYHMAWINGTAGGDTIAVKSLLSSSTQTLQAQYKRGVYVDGGAGADTITGSDYSDNIVGGAGNDLVDGGTHLAPTDQRGQDIFEVRLVASTLSEANNLLTRIKVLPSDNADYQWKVVQFNSDNVQTQVDYLKNIEAVSISVNTPTNQWLAGRWQTIALNVNELRLSKSDSSLTEWNSKVSDQMHFAWVNGTATDESFDYTGATAGAETITAATKALMTQYKRGLWVDLGTGNDTVVGSPFGDNFNVTRASTGVSFIDGGANEGTTPWGNRGADNMDVFVATRELAAGVTVTGLSATPAAGSAEASAKERGFTGKVMSGTTVLAYIKNIEYVNVQVWDDKNGDGQRQWDQDNTKNEMSWYSNFRLTVDINEVRLNATDATKTEWGTKLADQFHFAWINGTDGNDTITAKSLISSTTSALQAQYKRGVFIDAGIGNDIITGTDYSDNIAGGTGDDEVDGGTQIAPTGVKGEDIFEINLKASNQNAANELLSRVKILPSEKTGFDWKVVQFNANNEAIETDYLKNIETVRINVQQTSNNQWLAGKNVYVALNVNEIKISSTDSTKTDWGGNLSDQNQYVWVYGTSSSDEKFDYTGATSGAETVTANTKALMVRDKKGLWVDMQGGSDTAVGSPYGDWFNILASDTGIDYYDGGDNLGTNNRGDAASDNVDVYVDSQAVAGTISTMKLVKSTSQVATDDSRAFDAGYTFKILKGTTPLAYLKNIERVSVHIWTDTNGNGNRDYPSEVQSLSNTDLIPTVYYNTTGDATRNGISINATASPETINVADILKTLPSSTDPTRNWAGTNLEVNVNADRGTQGNDILIGSSNPDVFTVGIGTNYIDGGANQGRFSWANSSAPNTYDFVQIFVPNELEARYVEIAPVVAGKDDTAIAGGYLYKVTYGDSIAYVKNVEQVSIKIWNDADNNGTKDWATEVFNFNNYILQSPLISWTQGVKGSSSAPPSTVIISGSAYTPNLDASALINSFIAERKAYPISSTDLAASFQLSDIANFSSSYGAYIQAGSGDHVIKGTEFTDIFMVAPNGNNLIQGGDDTGYYIYNGSITSSVDSLRITEKVNFEILTLPQSFIRIAPGSTKAFSNNNTPNSTGDDVTDGSYALQASDKLTLALLPKDGKISFNATPAQMLAYAKAFENADTPVKLKAAIEDVSNVALVKYAVFAGYTNVGGTSAPEWMSFANLSAPDYSNPAEVRFSAVSVADNFLSSSNILGTARFDVTRHHLISLTLNKDLLSGSSTTSQDTAAINAFATSKGVNLSDYKFALLSFNDFQQLTGVQLIDNVEKIEFRLWLDANLDGNQSGNEVSNSFYGVNLKVDTVIHQPSDLNASSLAGKQYAGSYLGVSSSQSINLKTLMQSQIGAAEQTKKLGIRAADFEGDDTVVGTDFDDFFWLGKGVDSIDGGSGTDRLGFFWKPAAAANLSMEKNGNVITLKQTATATNAVTSLATITLTDTGGSILQLSSTLASTYGLSSNFAMTTADTFTNVEEIAILLDPSLKQADGNFPYLTGGITDVSAYVIKIKPTADYSLSGDATKSSINITGTAYADVINASTLIEQLPTSTNTKDDWKNSNLNTFITLSGGGDTLVGSNFSDLIDPGTGVNYIDGGTNIGRTNWTPTWISSSRTYWGAEAALDHVRFYIKQASDASKLAIVKLSTSSTGTDKTAFDNGYTTKASFTDYNNQISTNYLKNIEYVGLRTWIDSNNNNIKDASEATSSSSYFVLDTAVVSYRFVDLNNSSNGPYLFDVSLGKYVDKVNAQDAIDAYISNRKNYPVLKEDKVTLDFPADYKLSDYVNYNKAYGAYIMAGLGDHYIVGTNYADTIVAAEVGNNWYDGGSDIGYVKYVKSATDVTGQISVARDAYRLTRTVTSESNISDTSIVSKTGIKLIRLSDKFDLLNPLTSLDTVSLDAITAATASLKAKFNIGADVEAEYAVVKTKTVNSVTEILGVDLLRNIEIFQMRNWFDADGNSRPNGSEVSDINYNTNDLLIDNTLYQTADQTFMTLHGVNYAGVVFGTSGSDTINLQSNLTSMLQANPDISNNNRGLIFADRLGNDTLTGTNFNDFFWLSTGTDSIDAGAGTQDRVGIYWAPSSTGGSASISTVTSTDKKTIKVVQIQGGTTTDLMRFTLNDSSATDKYWSVEQLNTTFSQLYLNNSIGSQAVTLRGVEQAVFALPSTLLGSNDQPLITLTGLTNNMLVVDLTVV